MLYGSVHVDPAAGWFPHVVRPRRRDRRRRRARARPATVPLPGGHRRRPAGSTPSATCSTGSTAAGCSALVVSLGVDAAADDPESPLLVTADGYRAAGRVARRTGLPTVAVQEGGYHLPTLGGLVAAYLDGHAAATPIG